MPETLRECCRVGRCESKKGVTALPRQAKRTWKDNYTESLFESIRHVNEYGKEFWFARKLQTALEYKEWRNFKEVLDKAIIACNNSENASPDHFVEVNKLINMCSSAEREINDYELSRYACYLIVQNGDPHKKMIALGQTCREKIAGKEAAAKLDHLQMVVDESGKNYPTLRKLKTLLGLIYKYAIIHEIIPKERNMIEYLNIKNAGNPNAYDRKPFTKTEVNRVWNAHESNIYYTVILMLIYSGCRISELLDLKKEHVNLEEHYFNIVQAKTAAGIRVVPIADKVLPFFEYWYENSKCEYLLCTPDGEHFICRNYYDSYWSPLVDVLNIDHAPHCTRHTCISMLTVAGVDDKVIKKIVGHKGQSVTEVVYTHFEIEELIDAINKI